MRPNACSALTAILALAAGCTPRPVIDATRPDAGVPTRVPDFGPTVTAAVAPPAISGGTLLVTRDGSTAVAADPDRDQVYLVDLASRTLRTTVALAHGDEPGRATEDGAGRVHVSLRGAGALATIDLASGTLLARRSVCAAPRGVAFDPRGDLVHVACAGGELVSLPSAGGAATRTLKLAPDLRDVVVESGRLWVTTFRTPSAIEVADDGSVAWRITLPSLAVENTSTPRLPAPDGGAASDLVHFSPAIAWRAVALPSGGLMMAHQLDKDDPIGTGPGAYGGTDPCFGGAVQSTVSVVQPGLTPVAASVLAGAVLPVDVAVARDGATVAVAAPGNARFAGAPQVLLIATSALVGGRCVDRPGAGYNPPATVTAVAFDAGGRVLAQTREPAALYLFDGGTTTSVALSSDSRADTGHAVFHANAGAGLACASCHAEGGEDGRVWNFDTVGPRRTQSLRGGILPTAPFHWAGEMQDMPQLVHDVFALRMGGPTLSPERVTALSHWVDAIPLVAHAAPADPAAVARGRALFEDATVGCAGCHAGSLLTNNATVDVGTGEALQVPSLRGVAFRAPFMHNGCAPALRDRFGACGGSAHGNVAGLSPQNVDDLVAYLETL